MTIRLNYLKTFFINTKKELSIADNPLLENSKIVNFTFGMPKGLDVGAFIKCLRKINLVELRQLVKIIKTL